ncbi:hypothetical protein IAD21_00697 [Abditibacteriota bacterium]|nr:hypothetical protein IAD21_00697 [Abditibacteriota bacterium]
MTPKIIRTMRHWLGRETSKENPVELAPSRIEFQLTYGSLLIGTLGLQNGVWEFAYSDEFRTQSKIRSLIEFPDMARTYRTEELWPFFSTRTPSLKQTAVRALIEKEHIDPNDEARLLQRFGRRTIANPFELAAS